MINSSRVAPHCLHVYPATALTVVNGANLGDPISFAEELVPDDVYRLGSDARTGALHLGTTGTPPYQIAEGSPLGTPGGDLYLDCCVTFMTPAGQTTEALVMVETDPRGMLAAVYVMPLAELPPQTDLVLIGLSKRAAIERFAQTACVSFAGGTRITMADGSMRRIEDLRPGDMILTRDAGPQPLRWIGHQTQRATGAFAPVLIRKGTLNNTADLRVSPDHRLFVYQRRNRLGTGAAESLVRARHLVNGDSVIRMEGGHIDYFQMLFDAHQIVFAEGIAAETMQVDTRTKSLLPVDVARHFDTGHRGPARQSTPEVPAALLSRPDAVARLRQASRG